MAEQRLCDWMMEQGKMRRCSTQMKNDQHTRGRMNLLRMIRCWRCCVVMLLQFASKPEFMLSFCSCCCCYWSGLQQEYPRIRVQKNRSLLSASRTCRMSISISRYVYRVLLVNYYRRRTTYHHVLRMDTVRVILSLIAM